jgi:hypothetical protein
MIERIITRFPEGWREVAELVLAPIAWVPRLQEMLLAFFVESDSPWSAAAKYVFLMFPLLMAIVAIWCTQISLYTLPFRSSRGRFVSLLLLAWWDAARVVWMYWVGIIRLAGVVLGWGLALANLAVRIAIGIARQVVTAPFAMTSMATRSYFQPGVPWIAFLMLVFWCVLEAAVFAYTLRPTITEVLADLVGSEDISRFSGPILYMMLLLLIMGSFACVQALVDAVRKREAKFMVQIILVELFVMFFEVMFLYRELVDAITPWIAQQTGVKMGLGFTLSLATFGWIGVRGMTWYLFGQYGTPPLLAFIARQPIAVSEQFEPAGVAQPTTAWWRPALADFKTEINWLHGKSDELLEALALPVLHLLGAALNFAMILTAARPVFNLPFRGLREVTETRDVLATTLHLQPRKQVSM